MKRKTTRNLFGMIRQRRVEQWESHCNRCGLCCHEKTLIGNEVIYDLDSWCEHYDPETKLCRIYAKRLTEHSRCKAVTLRRAMFSSYLPPTCGYVQWAQSHHLRWAPYRRIRYVRNGDDSDPDLILSEAR